MAKISLISRKLTPQTLGLAQALKFHRHEVMIITSHEEAVPDNLGFPVLTYFKNWSALEAVRFFPHLLGQAPEIWHFVFSENENDRPRAAHWALSALARTLRGRVVAASFYGSPFHFPGRRIAGFTRSCDIVTTATRENLMFMKRRGWLTAKVETEVLPPFVSKGKLPEGPMDDADLSQLISAIKPFLVVPSELLPEIEWTEILQKIRVVVCGPRPEKTVKALGFRDLPAGLFYVGHLASDDLMSQLLRGSSGLLTAYDDFSAVELLNYHRLCHHTRTPILANSRQAEALPGFCVHKRNGFLIDQRPRTLANLLSENPRLELNQALFEPIKSDLADSALNELNRLYSKVHHLKTSSFDMKRSSIS